MSQSDEDMQKLQRKMENLLRKIIRLNPAVKSKGLTCFTTDASHTCDTITGEVAKVIDTNSAILAGRTPTLVNI